MAEITYKGGVRWGTPLIEVCKWEGGVLAEKDLRAWVKVPTPKEGTTQLNTEEGQKKEAIVEGGDAIDAIISAPGKTITFDIYLPVGEETELDAIFPSKAGVASDFYAVRIGLVNKPEAKPTFIEKARVSFTEGGTFAEGLVRTYTIKALKVSEKDAIRIGED